MKQFCVQKFYGELNLKEIREKCGLDFAHYTYPHGMCPCCTCFLDFPKRYWNPKRRPQKIVLPDSTAAYELDGKRVTVDDFTYLLFLNSDRDGGYATKDTLIDSVNVAYRFVSDQQKSDVCRLLSKQLGKNYVVAEPMHSWTVLRVYYLKDFKCRSKEKDCYYNAFWLNGEYDLAGDFPKLTE